MEFLAFLPIIIVLVLYFTGIPIAYALFASILVYFGFIDNSSPMDLILQKFVSSAQSFSLLAIPFFIMAGSIMTYAGISTKMMNFAETLTGHLPGGLAQVNVLLSMLMGGCSGSANADAAMDCKMLVPVMEEKGYSKAFSAAVSAASSAATPVIPPGINLIVYALIAGVSVNKMFMGGYAPGILMGVCMMVCVHIISKKRGYLPSRNKRATLIEIVKSFIDSLWGVMFPVVIMGGMRIGLFTPSECGAIAVLYCVIVGVVCYKQLKPEHFPIILKETVEGTSSVILIIVAANVFGYYMTWEGIPQLVANAMLGITQNKYVMLFLINILLLVVGMFIEGGAALIILAPLLCPVVSSLGIDLVHFGLICIVNIMIGGLTPPFGSMMFACCSITGCKIEEFVKEVIPFIISLLIALLIVAYIPQFTLILPNLFY